MMRERRTAHHSRRATTLVAATALAGCLAACGVSADDDIDARLDDVENDLSDVERDLLALQVQAQQEQADREDRERGSAGPGDTEDASAAGGGASPPSEFDAGPGGPSNDLTPPGRDVALGDWVTIPATIGTRGEGTVGVRVISIEAGDPADFGLLNLSGDQVAGLRPWYVRGQVMNLGFGQVQATAGGLSDVFWQTGTALTGDGSRATTLGVIGDYTPCNTLEPRDSFSDVINDGGTVISCSAFVAPIGVDVDSWLIEGSVDDVFERYRENPITMS